jgi:hypothetical protein
MTALSQRIGIHHRRQRELCMSALAVMEFRVALEVVGISVQPELPSASADVYVAAGSYTVNVRGAANTRCQWSAALFTTPVEGCCDTLV